MKKMKPILDSKTCTVCGIEKPIDNFRTHKSGFILNQCRQCERDMAKKRMADKRGTAATTPQKVCTECGINKPINDFRTHKNGFILNQCRQCERDMSKKKRIEDKRSKDVTERSTFYSSTSTIGKSVPFTITCAKCGKDKPLNEFRHKKSGIFLNICRKCEKENA